MWWNSLIRLLYDIGMFVIWTCLISTTTLTCQVDMSKTSKQNISTLQKRLFQLVSRLLKYTQPLQMSCRSLSLFCRSSTANITPGNISSQKALTTSSVSSYETSSLLVLFQVEGSVGSGCRRRLDSGSRSRESRRHSTCCKVKQKTSFYNSTQLNEH